MKEFTRKVVSAVAPVFGVVLALSVLQAAEVPWPPALAWDAWPQWAVFTAMVYACTSLCIGVAERVCGTPVGIGS